MRFHNNFAPVDSLAMIVLVIRHQTIQEEIDCAFIWSLVLCDLSSKESLRCFWIVCFSAFANALTIHLIRAPPEGRFRLVVDEAFRSGHSPSMTKNSSWCQAGLPR